MMCLEYWTLMNFILCCMYTGNVDTLYKAGLQMDFWQWQIEETKEGSHYEFYHRMFIDMADHSGRDH